MTTTTTTTTTTNTTTGTTQGYRPSPDHDQMGWPAGVGFIIGNEGCERFSFYGMRAILYAHMASLYVLTGVIPEQANNLATSTTHLFFAGVYALPMVGALIADRLVGKYTTILVLSLIYCCGHAALAMGDGTLTGMYIGLALISIGAGGIKPCVSANVGDQFGRSNWFRVRTVYQMFYFIINFGSLGSTLLIPYLKAQYGASVAFGVPGILMLIATFIFWLGRKRYVHVPARPGGRLGLIDTAVGVSLFLAIGHLFFTSGLPWAVEVAVSVAFLAAAFALFRWRQSITPDDGFLAVMLEALLHPAEKAPTTVGGSTASVAAPVALDDPSAHIAALASSSFWRSAVRRYGVEAVDGTVSVLRILSVFAMVSVFWALFDQHSTSWIRQAAQMNLTIWPGTTLLPTQISALNPAMVMLLLPVMNVVYKLVERGGIRATPLRRMTTGMFIASLSFVAVALIQHALDVEGEGHVSIWWQVIPYALVTVAEVMVSVTGLEFAYTQAPKRMKSTLVGFWSLTVAVGNVLVALLARFSSLKLESFFWLFAGLMAGAALLFGIRAAFYTLRDRTQD